MSYDEITEDGGVRVEVGPGDPAAITIAIEEHDAEEQFERINTAEESPRLEVECSPKVQIFRDGRVEVDPWVEIGVWHYTGEKGEDGTGQTVLLSLDAAEAFGKAMIEIVRRVRSGEVATFAEERERADPTEWGDDDE